MWVHFLVGSKLQPYLHNIQIMSVGVGLRVSGLSSGNTFNFPLLPDRCGAAESGVIVKSQECRTALGTAFH